MCSPFVAFGVVEYPHRSRRARLFAWDRHRAARVPFPDDVRRRSLPASPTVGSLWRLRVTRAAIHVRVNFCVELMYIIYSAPTQTAFCRFSRVKCVCVRARAVVPLAAGVRRYPVDEYRSAGSSATQPLGGGGELRLTAGLYVTDAAFTVPRKGLQQRVGTPRTLALVFMCDE